LRVYDIIDTPIICNR